MSGGFAFRLINLNYLQLGSLCILCFAIVQSGVRKQFAALLTALWQLNRVANSTYINSYSIHIY